MALQILPIIKAVAPYLTQITASAIPAFTSKPAETVKVDPVIAKQIEELQSAATRNSESVQGQRGQIHLGYRGSGDQGVG